ncbi:MAG TPA: biopolymer transporter ExbD [Steroidobacteraceae bacterium]|nr:biopolymer transporter ExbD [Steroidobacteraceae bacterium]
MAMQVGSSDDASMCEMNTTPLIDVMLVLLIVFIITIPVLTHAVKLDNPIGNPPPPPAPPEVINLEIDFDNTILWNTTPIDMPTLISYLQSDSTKVPQPEVHLKPNKRSKYDTVAKVLAACQRNGIKKIGFVGNEQFLSE